MEPVQKALWFVESHSRDPIGLQDVADACNVSIFHLTRAFAATMGLSLMRYLRARRLSEAARQLAHGADDILTLALDSGYGSHEAFTRGFRDQFALTPEQVRARGDLSKLQLTEAIVMSATSYVELIAPRIQTIEPIRLAGLVERYHCQASGGIPDQWQRFLPHYNNLRGQVGPFAYGASYHFDDDGNFDYMCGVEVTPTAELPANFKTLKVPTNTYAVFKHPGHVAGIRAAFSAIWSKWFPESGYKAVNAPTLERYGPEFDSRTGSGRFEIWIAVGRVGSAHRGE